MTSSNPYAPPRHDELGELLPRGTLGGVGLVGNVLVCDKGASLPRLCLFTGEPANGRISKKLQWAPQWVLVLAAVSPLIGMILYFVLRKSGRLEYSLSEVARKRKASGLWIAIGGGFGAVLLGIAAAAANQPAFLPLLCLVALVAIVVGVVRTQLIRVVKIDNQQIRIKLRPDAVRGFARHFGSPG